MSLRRRAAALAGIAICAASIGGAVDALAQAAAPPVAPTPAPAAAPAPELVGPPAPPRPTGPVAIPVGEVGAAIEGGFRRLAEIRSAVTADPIVEDVEKEAFGKEQIFHERVVEAARKLSDDITLDELEEIGARASAAERQLALWQKALTAHSQQLEKAKAAVKELKETWSLTYDAAKKENAPSELIENVKALRTEIRDVEKAIGDRFDQVLKVQGLVAEESTAVSVLTQDVRRARFDARGRLFERDRRALHQVFLALDTVDPVLKRVQDGLERDWNNIKIFASLEGGKRIAIHALVFFAILLVAVRLKSWSSSRRGAGKSLGPSEEVFDHPLSTSLLFGVLVTPWIHPFLPRAYLSLLGLLLVIPILVLVPNVLAPRFRRAWYGLAAIFLLDRVRGVFQPVEVLDRSFFLIETIAGAGVAVWFLMGDRFADLTTPRFRGFVRLVLRIAVVGLVVSAAANLAGFFSLASLIGQGILRSALSAIVLYAAVSVARPLFAGILRTGAASSLQILHGRRAAVEKYFARLLSLAALLWWIERTLEGFSVAQPLHERITAWMAEPLPLGNVGFSLGDVLLFLLTAAAGVLLSRLVRALLDEDVFPRTRLARGVPHAISATVRYAILFAGFLLAAAAAGFDWSRITLLAGAFGVGIGFGLQNIVNNFISGLILLYERPIQVGDTVEVKNLIGEVKRIGIRSSSVRTGQGAEVIVPNASLISEQVVNWTLSDRSRRVELPVAVTHGAEPEQVLALLEEVGKAHPDVMQDPPPAALFQGFGETTLNFELRVWTSNFDGSARLRSEIALAVYGVLRKAGIAIPAPQRDMHVTIDPPRGT